MSQFHTVDLTLLLIYFFVVLLIGFYFAKKHSTSEDYFLAGRNLSWFTIGFSLFASNISSTTLVGLSGAAYSTGISISNYEWMAAIVLVVFSLFFIPFYINSRIFTMPEFLEKRFGPAPRYYFSAMTIVGNLFIDTAGTLFAGALVIQYFFPGVEIWQSALLLAIVAGLYTAAGGLSAVVYTDVIQAVILLIGSTAITWLALEQMGSWESMIAQTPPEMLSLVRPLDDPTMPWLGLITGVPILGFYFWCTNQFIVQRVLGAKDTDHARWGSLLAGLLKLPVLYIMVFPGVMARFIFPDLPRADLVFPTMVTELLPVGLRGLVVAGLVAAIMSSIDSTLHSASTLVTMDFVKKWKPQISATALTKVGRTVTLCFMVFSALWTPVVARFSTLFEYLQSALAFLVPPVAAVFFLGVFWSRANSKSVMAALVGSHAFSITVLVLKQFSWFPQIHFLIWAFIFFITALVLMVTVSIYSPAEQTAEQSSFTLSRSNIYEIFRTPLRQPFWTDYRLQSIALLGLTAWMVSSYW